MDSSNNYPQPHLEQKKPIKQSRWVKKSKVDRYDKNGLTYIADHFREAAGWWRGARARRTATKTKAMRIDQ